MILNNEPSFNKSQRIVLLLHVLTRKNGIGAGSLMRYLRVDGRTLRRYLADLRQLGFDIEDTHHKRIDFWSDDRRLRIKGARLILSDEDGES